MSDNGNTPDLKDAARAGWRTAWQTFIALFGMTLLSFTQGVAEWASSSGAKPLPGLSVLGYGVVAAACALVTGVVSFVVNAAQAASGKGRPARYDG